MCDCLLEAVASIGPGEERAHVEQPMGTCGEGDSVAQRRHGCGDLFTPAPGVGCGAPTRLTSAVPHLYYWNAGGRKDIFGRPLPLTCSVEISSTLKIKAKMLACHASQRNWLKRHHHYDRYIEIMKSGAKAEGERAGLKAAEGFIQHLGDGYPQDNILKTILKNRCVEF